MSDWRPIETAKPGVIENFILWNGRRVVGWYSDSERAWCHSEGYDGDAIDPQPTLWHPWPEDPK